MKSYEAKQAARKQRFETMAKRTEQESEAVYGKARKMASVIPYGQPILIGHHSEKRDRNYRAKIENTYGKSFKLMEKAKHYENKAASVGYGGISGVVE